MSLGPLSNAIRRTLFREYPASADGQLLERFVARQDQAAFEEIVRRHGPMVLQVCRRLLGHHQDAEDAFQATFLVLSRKAREVAALESVGGWLHGVACRTALNARKLRGLRPGTFDSQVGFDVHAVSEAEPGTGLAHDDLRAVLDEELARLPRKYRVPMVLCYLEGKSTEEAARQLGWPSGTVKTQMHRARELLRKRLTRRGMTLAAAALAVELPREAAWAALPATLLASTVRSAAAFAEGAGAVPAAAAQLAGVVLKDLSARKLRWAASLFLLLGGTGLALALTLSKARKPEAVSIEKPEITPVAVFRSGGGPCRAAAFSADARIVATVNVDGELEIWDNDYASGKRKLRLRGEGAGACCIDFAPDDTRLAVGYRDGTVRLWDVVAGTSVATLTGAYRGEPSGLVFSPNGQTLALTAPESGVTVWNLRNNEIRGRIAMPGPVGVTFTPDSGELVGLHARDWTVKRWDAVTLRENPVLVPSGWRVAAIASGGEAAVVLRTNNNLGLAEVGHLDLQSLKVRSLFALPKDGGKLNFMPSPKADIIVYRVESTDTLFIWGVDGGKKLGGVPRPFLTCVAYSRDGKILLVSGFQKEPKPGTKSVPFYCDYFGLKVMRQQLAAPKNP